MQALKGYLAVFCGVCLPLSVLAELEALLKFEQIPDIALSAGIGLLACIALSVVCYLLTEVFSAILGRLIRQPHLPALCHRLLALACAALALLTALATWVATFSNHFAFGLLAKILVFAFLLLASLGLVLWRGVDAISSYAQQLVQRCTKPALVAAMSIFIAAVMALVLIGTGPRSPATAVAQTAKPNAPHVFLITLDSLTASALELYGNAHVTTPNISQFAGQGMVFKRFYASSNFTMPTSASIQSGSYPWSHRLINLNSMHQSKTYMPSLAAEFHQAGYTTAQFTANWLTHPVHHMQSQGWDHLEAPLQHFPRYLYNSNRLLPGCSAFAACDMRRLQSIFPFNAYSTVSLTAWKKLGGPEQRWDAPYWVTAAAERFLDQRNDPQKPVFAWVHVYPPHDPYTAEAPFLGQLLPSAEYRRVADYDHLPQAVLNAVPAQELQKLRLRYEENLRYSDHYVGKFIEGLKRRGLWENAIVAISTDHGESFGRGYFGHTGILLSEDLIHVPLIIKTPAVTPGQTELLTSQADLAPTLLGLAGLPAPVGMEGRSVAAVLTKAEMPAPKPVFAMSFETNSAFAPLQRGTVAVIDGPWKFVRYLHQAEKIPDELYALDVDPVEHHNLIDAPHLRATQQRLSALIADSLAQANHKYAQHSP